MGESIRLGRVAGIAIGINWSLLVIAGLLGWALGDLTFPAAAPHYGWAAYTLAAAVVVVCFFGALLAHELAHSLVARRRGVQVDRITLWLFGGVSQLRGEMATPRAELAVAIIGPLTSLGLAVLFGAVAGLVQLAHGPTLVEAATAWLAGINALLAFFNLLPGAPLDGGRVLHAIVWHRSGSHALATAVASRAGQYVGYGLIALGIVALLGGDLFAVWFMLIGWFLLSAARAEATHEMLSHALAPLRVRDVMTPNPVVAPASTPLGDLLDEWFVGRGHSAFPLRDNRGRINGLVTLYGVRHRMGHGARTARDVADDITAVARVSPEDTVPTLLQRLNEARGGDGRALVFDGEELVGIVSPTDLQRALDVAALQRDHPGVGRSLAVDVTAPAHGDQRPGSVHSRA